MTQKEFIDTVRNMRYWQRINKSNPSSIGNIRQKEMEDLIDTFLESH